MKTRISTVCAVLLTVVLFLIVCNIRAQGNYEDVVYLKNGSVIRGMIIEQVPGKTVKIQTADRSIFVYQMEEIEKMTREAVYVPIGQKKEKSKFKTHGYTNITEFGPLFPVSSNLDYTGVTLQFTTVNGVMFNPYLSLGLGIGVNRFWDQAIAIPFSIDLRVNFIKTRFTPVYIFNFGYAVGVSSEVDLGGGPFIDSGFGVKGFISRSVAITLSARVKAQFVTESEDDDVLNLIMTGFQLGFVF
jgi:hypothetical protein